MKNLLLILSLVLATNAWGEKINFNCEAGGQFDGYEGYKERHLHNWIDKNLQMEVGNVL